MDSPIISWNLFLSRKIRLSPAEMRLKEVREFLNKLVTLSLGTERLSKWSLHTRGKRFWLNWIGKLGINPETAA